MHRGIQKYPHSVTWSKDIQNTKYTVAGINKELILVSISERERQAKYNPDAHSMLQLHRLHTENSLYTDEPQTHLTH